MRPFQAAAETEEMTAQSTAQPVTQPVTQPATQLGHSDDDARRKRKHKLKELRARLSQAPQKKSTRTKGVTSPEVVASSEDVTSPGIVTSSEDVTNASGQ